MKLIIITIFVTLRLYCVTCIKSNTTTLRTERIGFLPALSANKGQNKHFVGAFQFALEHINKEWESLGYRINSTTVDNKADTLESIRGMTSLYLNGTIAFIGPEDTCAIEAKLAAAWNVPMIAFVCENYICIIFLSLA